MDSRTKADLSLSKTKARQAESVCVVFGSAVPLYLYGSEVSSRTTRLYELEEG